MMMNSWPANWPMRSSGCARTPRYEAIRWPSTAEFLDALRACRRLHITVAGDSWKPAPEHGPGQAAAPRLTMAAISEIWLGDLIRAVALIPGDADMRRRIAELLGLTEQVPDRPPAGGGRNDQAALAMASFDLADAWSAADASGARTARARPGSERLRGGHSVPELQPVDHVPATPTDWAPVPSLPRVTERNLAGRPRRRLSWPPDRHRRYCMPWSPRKQPTDRSTSRA